MTDPTGYRVVRGNDPCQQCKKKGRGAPVWVEDMQGRYAAGPMCSVPCGNAWIAEWLAVLAQRRATVAAEDAQRRSLVDDTARIHT